MGFAVPAALGAQTARPEREGAGDRRRRRLYEMTGMELSTIVRRKLPVVVIVLNNGTERLLHPGDFAQSQRHSQLAVWTDCRWC